MNQLYDPAPDDLIRFGITLGLTFVLGLEREDAAEHSRVPTMAGVRTMPLIGLLGHMLMVLGGGELWLPAVGLVMVGGLTMIGHADKLRHSRSGLTTELTMLIAYVVGLLSAHGNVQSAAALVVATVLLLTGKQPLRRFAAQLPPQEIKTFVTFLLLAAVILPVLPNRTFTRFNLNPFNAWVVVVAVSAISYASYLLQKLVRSDESVLLAAVLGGLYSSTATTIALARRSASAGDGLTYAGGIILATGAMYLRVLILVWMFSAAAGRQLALPMLVLAALGSLAGVVLILRRRGTAGKESDEIAGEPHPLEVRAAAMFATLFLGLQVITQLTTQYLGTAGLLGLALLVGLTDIVPFILGLTDSMTGGVIPQPIMLAIMISIASNNVVKGVYALALGKRATGIASLIGLGALAVLTIAAVWVMP